MTAATVTLKTTEKLAEDNVVLTVSDGETYVTRLSSIFGVHSSYNEDLTGQTTALQTAHSGRTITIHALGVSDKKVFLTVRGKL